MATSSSWRSSNATSGPRWSQGVSSSAHQTAGNAATSPAAAASIPRSAGMNSISSSNDHDSNDIETIQRDRILYLLVGLVGNTVMATTRSGIKYVGILSSTSVPENGTESLGAILSCAQQILKDGGLGSVKKMLIIKGDDLDSLTAKDVGLDVPVSMSNANRSGFRTDTEISKKALDSFGEGRTLQKWADDNDSLSLEGEGAFASIAGSGGGGGGNSGWDQFAANEARFGVKSNYEETLYTTKLDKSAKDYKDREKKAEQLAREIMNSSTNNIHVAEERNLAKEGEEGQTEEDRYGAVVRGANAYVPPAARRAAAIAAAAGAQSTIKANGTAREEKANGSQGSPAPALQIPTITSTPAAREGTDAASGHPTPDAVGDFRQFVTSERERLEKKKAALAKKEKDTKLADLKNWGDKFKLKFPVSDDGTSEGSEKPRDRTLQKSVSPPTTHVQKQARALEDVGGTSSVSPSPKTGPAKIATAEATVASKARLAETKAMLAKMTIPKIPPFNPEKARIKPDESSSLIPAVQASPADGAASSSKSIFKMSAKASSFKPFNPNAAAFTPGAGAAVAATAGTATASPSIVPSVTPSESLSSVTSPRPAALPKMVAPSQGPPANPFFGNRVLKKTTPLHVREDFNPFKNAKVPESQTVGPTWGFSGKGYRTLFHVVPAEEGNNPNHLIHMQQQQQQQQQQPMPSMTPVHNMLPMGMHPHAVMGQQGLGTSAPPPSLPHLQQHNQAAMGPNNGQGFYMPYGAAQGSPYRFQGGQQPMQQMPAGYGQIPPHYLPFSPPMPPSVPPVYSPQMGNMFPHSASMHNMGVSPAQVPPPPSRNGSQMQGKVPQHVYNPNAPYPPMSPIMRQQHQQQQQHHPHQHPPAPPPQQQQQQPQVQPQQGHSGTPSQSGSAAG